MILIILASIGLVLVLIGRWIILREAADLGPGSRWLVRLAPFYELILLVSGHERAHRGSLIGVVGLALAIPLAAQMLLAVHARQDIGEAWRRVAAPSDPIAESVLDDEEQSRFFELQDEKVRRLTAYMTEWYVLLESEREYLCAPDAIENFNRSVAAYRDLRSVQEVEMKIFAEMKPAPTIPSVILPPP